MLLHSSFIDKKETVGLSSLSKYKVVVSKVAVALAIVFDPKTMLPTLLPRHHLNLC
jgi:hypothetical protein